MWSIISIITLTYISILSTRRRFQRVWVGKRGVYRGKEYVYKAIERNSKMQSLLIGCDSIENIDLYLKPEKWWDKIFKRLQISVEPQVDNAEFDNALYIVGENELIINTLSELKTLQAEISEIFDFCNKLSFELKALHIRQGRLWIKAVPHNKENPPSAMNVANKIAPKLLSISESITQNLRSKNLTSNDYSLLSTIVILAISSGMAITGSINLIRLFFVNVPFIIDVREHLLSSFLLGSIIIGILIGATFLLLGRTSRFHIVLIELLIVGYFGSVATAFTLTRTINMEFDKSYGKQYIVQVQETRVERSRRSRSYYLTVNNWLDDGQKTLRVSPWFFASKSQWSNITLIQKPGLLGYRWVESLK